MTFAHGERFGNLTVLRKAQSRVGRSARWWVGCSCGRQERYNANALMRAGGITKCSRCRKAEQSCKDSVVKSQEN